jgi:drug/metabolite transporter (DMT)-like permease
VKGDRPWLPLLMPLVVFGVVAVGLISTGLLLLQVQYATGDWVAYPHSLGTIIVAMVLGTIITVACWLYARGGKDADTPHHGPRH